LLSAGLFLTHYRLFVFFATFVIAALAVRGRDTRGWKAIGAAAALGAALALPWMIKLGIKAVPRLLASPGRLAAGDGYNAFPVEYFASGLERGWIALALGAVAWGVVRRDRALIALAAWVAVTFALLNLGPGTWLVNNNSWAITLFVPGAVALGWGADRLFSLERCEWGFGMGALRLGSCALSLGACALAAFAGVRGLRVQVEIVRPVTALALAEDAAALQWVKENTPPDSVFLVNGWLWLPRIWASPDGGAWLWPLAGRQSTLPPLDYAYQADWLAEVSEFNETAASVFAGEVDSPEALALLRRAGVTHVFIGARGGTLKPEAFAASDRYRLLYSNGGAWVFEALP
jgi:hypothetical protein